VTTTGELERAFKAHVVGTHRLTSPVETLARIKPMMRAMGITRVADITGLDVIGVPVVAVTRPNSRSLSVAQGKGLDLIAAKVSGLMEAIESFHAERIRAPLLRASAVEMSERGAVVDLARLPRVSGSAFDPGSRILWISGYDVCARSTAFVPYELVHTDYTLPLPSGSGAFMMNDSGLASGNHPLEATSHAICELVERDAMTLWQFQPAEQRAARRVALESVDDDGCRLVLDRFARAGVDVGIWDITSDIGIAAFCCTIADRSSAALRGRRPASGSGCHPTREIALLRALTEAAQNRLTIIAGSRDDVGLAIYRRAEDVAMVDAFLELLARQDEDQRSFQDVPTLCATTLYDDVSWELGQLARADIHQVVVFDLTLPELGIPVVRAVIPGLEGMHDSPGFMPGARLRAWRS
jgi:YcaO-like protein with predicted kinase domain